MNFILNTAWRDSRRSRQRLLLFMSAIVLGIAALVAINSFGDNLARSIDEQAQELLGADLTVTASAAPSQKMKNLLQGIGAERSSETAFASMVLFPRSGGVRLAQVKALEGRFPYYGTWEVQPASAIAQFRTNSERVALVDDALLVQFGVNVGDSVRVGEVVFRVAGRVLKTPGATAATAAVAPTVFVPATYLNQTGLLQKGSRVNYKYYYKFAKNTDVPALVKRLEPTLDKAGLNSDTVDNRKRQTGRAFADLTRFLNLVSFVALLLGCVGVASAVQLYVKEKITSVSILRTLGASGWQAFLIFLIQTAVMGLGGAVLGAALGSLLQWLMPIVFGSFLPVEVSVAISWPAIGQGIITGLLIALLFAALPLLLIRKISPLRTLRASLEADVSGRDPLRWVVFGLIALFVFGFAYWQTRDWKLAGGFTAGMAVSFLVLTGMGLALMAVVRRFFPRSWSFVWRQSLANLYRPQNQTLILLVSIGLGAFLITTLYLTQTLLLGRVQFSASGQQPNMVLFDIQREQTAGVRDLVTQSGLPVMQQVPIVTMRLESINGRGLAAIRKDTSLHIPEWALNREYRVTYRDSLIASEKLSSGKSQVMIAGVPAVTFEDDFMKRLHLKLGDKLTFNVQGAPIETIVGGTRTVDWNRVQTNFLVVFPTGVLEQAPQFSVLMTRVPTTEKSATFQRALVAKFPNVSAIDLGLILKTLDDILSKISFVIRFMALFSILTGLLVLSSSVIISKFQRMQESVLLRTLGASRRQILRITLVEYGLLGLLASLSGIVLSVIGTWVLARYVFEMPYAPTVWPLLAVVGTVTGLTMLIGLLNSRDVLSRPPLEVLRSE
ncbi:ABC transporter permease [Fibrivirga algicola]|uniref:FtsX-like permease family protein n=1 Tax=Fibrivirga algicola TaxID=2950420 RepID=A0ABX0QF01_9BACT|nr:FtsX-like permease family protein [Fibrivirga algicola]NID08624.1 FtsX-like permease family protein [Fibrivirga algicola]